jgi:hypothetical protein
MTGYLDVGDISDTGGVSEDDEPYFPHGALNEQLIVTA